MKSLTLLALIIGLLQLSTCSDMMMMDMPPKHLYKALFVMSTDAMTTLEGSVAAMNADVDTETMRIEAFNFFMDYYAINASNSTSDDFFVFKNSLNVATNPYYLVALSVTDSNGEPVNKIPVTNTLVWDDYYSIIAKRPFRVYGTYGGVDGKMVVKNAIIVYGKYRFMVSCPKGDHQAQFLEPITFKGICPMSPIDMEGNGNPDPSTGTYPFVCELYHPRFGKGMGSGVSFYMKTEDPNSPMRMYTNTNMLRFPGSLFEPYEGSPNTGITETQDIVPGGKICGLDTDCSV
jgi:hypothetical protein